MGSAAAPLTVLELGQRVKAKYPGQYDDIPDVDLGRKVKAKHPEYSDFVDVPGAPPPLPGELATGPSIASRAIVSLPKSAWRMAQNLTGPPGGGGLQEELAANPNENPLNPIVALKRTASGIWNTFSNPGESFAQDPLGTAQTLTAPLAMLHGGAQALGGAAGRLGEIAPTVARAGVKALVPGGKTAVRAYDVLKNLAPETPEWEPFRPNPAVARKMAFTPGSTEPAGSGYAPIKIRKPSEVAQFAESITQPGQTEAAPAATRKPGEMTAEEAAKHEAHGNLVRVNKNNKMAQYFASRNISPETVANMRDVEYEAHLKANGFRKSTGSGYSRDPAQARQQVVDLMRTNITPPPQ